MPLGADTQTDRQTHILTREQKRFQETRHARGRAHTPGLKIFLLKFLKFIFILCIATYYEKKLIVKYS